MQGSQSATVKVMIYLIEGVLPESYFANNLRGLSVDMAVFRDLLRLKLPELSRHLDHLQQDSKDSGTSYEPPLCDVFTMQWFLTLFSNCLPQNTVLRVWDLVFLEGDQILLRTALAIWQSLSDRMMSVRSADEFYSIMAVLTREMMEFGLMEPNSLIKAIDNMLIPEVGELREKYIYNISPWAVGTVAKMGVRLLYPDHGSPNHEDSCKDRGEPRMTSPFSNHPDREKIALDISALKRQYWKLRERQRQAHIILSANDVSACRSEGLTTGSSPALNHLLLGKRALLSAKGRRIEGAVPTQDRRRQAQTGKRQDGGSSGGREGQTMTWREARTRTRKGGTSTRSPSPSSSSSSSSSTELCDSSDSEESGDLLDKASDGEKPSSPAFSQISEADKSRGTSPVDGLSAKTALSSYEVPGESADSGAEAEGRTDIIADFGSLGIGTTLGVSEEPTPDSAPATMDSLSSRLSSADLITALPCDKTDGGLRVSPSSRQPSAIRLPSDSHTAGTIPEVMEQSLPSRLLPEVGLSEVVNPVLASSSLRTSPVSQTGTSGQTSSSYSTESASEGSTRRVDRSDRLPSSTLSNITKLDSSEMDSGPSVAPKVPKEMRKAPSSSQLGSSDVKWNRPPISSYSSIQLGAAVEPSKVPSSSISSMQLGSGETSSTYSSLSSLPKDDTLSSGQDWSRKLVEESLASIADRSLETAESPATSPEKTKTVEEKLKRRKSEIALLQILQENSQILQRIHQAHKIASPDEPDDIKDIRRRYGYRQSASLDSPKTPKLTESSPSPFIRNPSSLNRDVTIKLGMYPDRT
ncbi:hypothetical protein GE061_007682 [Apolygus lucorum]|uniref:Rab-GAP TBC domain-containing protein n=1 Tax=Apolygus lucorum TaxID=248454 RepID=A0A8S9WP07_APOLU|nr:hypothetical protein GE061_007682 [Apolygus lucorum]